MMRPGSHGEKKQDELEDFLRNKTGSDEVVQ